MSDLEDSETAVQNYERVRNLKKYDPDALRNNFLEVLSNDKDALYAIVEAANFYTNLHSIHDGCPSGDHQCDYCYSGDTEFDAKEGLKDALKKKYGWPLIR